MRDYTRIFASLTKVAEAAHDLNRELVKAGIEVADALLEDLAEQAEQSEQRRENTPMTLEQRLAHHREMALCYYNAYLQRTVEDGASYREWVFAPHAQYWSPYFGDNLIDLDKTPISVRQSATMKANTYCLTFPDWGPLDFACWPSDQGFVMKTHFGGHDQDGKLWDFYAYGFVNTNEAGEITRWETHVSSEYNDFLDKAIGVHGPFKNGPEPYMQAVAEKLRQAGTDPQAL